MCPVCTIIQWCRTQACVQAHRTPWNVHYTEGCRHLGTSTSPRGTSAWRGCPMLAVAAPVRGMHAHRHVLCSGAILSTDRSGAVCAVVLHGSRGGAEDAQIVVRGADVERARVARPVQRRHPLRQATGSAQRTSRQPRGWACNSLRVTFSLIGTTTHPLCGPRNPIRGLPTRGSSAALGV